MRFLADAMLGRLDRRLRQMGHDTLYMRDTPDSEVLRVARAEGRMLITRDTELAGRANPAGTVLLRGNDTDGQLAELIGRLGPVMEGAGPPRCPRCNGALREAASRAEVEALVPEHVLHGHSGFYICSGCGNVYWEGTQYEAMMEMLEKFRGGETR